MRAPDFWYHEQRAPGLERGFLLPAASIYRAMGWLHRRLARPRHARVPVICVGNLTLGGTGKTPVAAAIAAMARHAGLKPAMLLRGYRGKLKGPLTVTSSHTARDVGDEALMHQAQNHTIICGDRVKGADHAVRAGADLVIMDDGFQNPGLAKDLSLLVIDAKRGFGNRAVFPAGPLRESIAGGLARAHGVVLMGDGAAPTELMNTHLPVFRAHLVPLNGSDFKGKRVVAFAGIGQPEKFFATLERCGAEVTASHGFADHAPIAPAKLEALAREAQDANALLVTTEKDYVRLGSNRAGIHVLKVEARFDDPASLGRLLAPVFAKARA